MTKLTLNKLALLRDLKTVDDSEESRSRIITKLKTRDFRREQ